MDFLTVFGLVGGLSLYAWGIIEGGSIHAFVNAHGIMMVMGGTLCATMIYCPARGFADAAKGALRIFKPSSPLDADSVLDVVSQLAKRAHQVGVDGLEPDVRAIPDDGFALRAYHTCLSNSDELSARNTIEREILQTGTRHHEVINIFKTLGVISPMMGLLGTVIGIVSVLRNISDPKMVGTSMGVAMSTAFYGILLSGFIFTPIAGKLRLRSKTELLVKEILMEGLLSIQYSDLPPTALERKLISYLAAQSILTRSKAA